MAADSGCTFGDIFEVSGYLGDNCGIFWGHYKIKCIDSSVVLCDGAFWLHWGYFENTFRVAGYLSDIFRIYWRRMHQSQCNGWLYVSAAFWLLF